MKLIASARAATILPLLMLPLAVASLWLLVAPHVVEPRVLVIVGAVVVAWYLLGGWIAVQRLSQGVTLARQARAARGALAAEPGCAWLVDPDGLVRGQSPQAERSRDLLGEPIAALLQRGRADPGAVAARLLSRAAEGRGAEVALPDGQRVTAARLPGSRLQVWRIAVPEPADDAPEPGSEAAQVMPLDLAGMPVAMLDMDAMGQVRAVNPAAEALLGRVPSGASMGDLLDGLGRPLSDWIAEVREGRSLGRGEVMRTRCEGQERDVQVTLAAAPGVDRIVAVLTDASALRTLEDQFVQSQKMQAIGQLAGGIAHDFNNLLTAISGHCDLLMVRRDTADPDYDDLHQISQNANRAAALVRQLLAFSRKQTLKSEIVDLRDTLSDLTHLLNRLVGERIVLTITHDPALRPIRGDARQLEQVLMNLVVNSRDAMPSGGEIAIHTENLRLGTGRTMEGANLPRGDYVRITVTDQGCGMPPEVVEKIFEPFFTTKRVGEGTGLGLSTAYGIVKQTGGYIFCRSTPGEGTVFSLYFPARKAGKPPAPPLEATAPATLPGGAAERRRVVLLVEDEAPVRSFARRALNLRGFDVIEADSGEAALTILRDEALTVDLLVSDVVMPGLDGPSWVREALIRRSGTPVIFMSGYTDVPLTEGQDPVPNALFLAKPFSLSELAASVERHLSDSGGIGPDAGRAATPPTRPAGAAALAARY
ncbi:ATP-binding protein [Paracoccus sanguinis]|uniref:ATP-binding protein n=1 Tax=Paracoccus sanguinis TaxID=1545044 RepID=UPI001451310E|nr:ATP-binding protein [Paracoccus sanguinis]QJD17594.1 response regulator [Paracoccus sanguinis]